MTEYCEMCGAALHAWMPGHDQIECIAHLRRRCNIMSDMLGLIFSPYERMASSDEDYLAKEKDTLQAVREAHKMIGKLGRYSAGREMPRGYELIPARPNVPCPHERRMDKPGTLQGTREHVCVECFDRKIVREERP